MTRRAFTLVELLVVIAIMITLMSLIMGGVMIAKRSALRAKAVSLLGAVASAVDQYRSLNNVYPELWVIPTPPPVDWNVVPPSTTPVSTWLSGLSAGDDVFNKAFNAASPPAITASSAGLIGNDKWLGINAQLAWQLRSYLSDQTKNGLLLDPWKMPLRYRPSKWYPYTTGSTVRIDGETPPGADSYQLWSSGPDGKDEPLNPGEGGDDIPQWAKIQ